MFYAKKLFFEKYDFNNLYTITVACFMKKIFEPEPKKKLYLFVYNNNEQKHVFLIKKQAEWIEEKAIRKIQQNDTIIYYFSNDDYCIK